uniref:Uncharacterized protein n=1 Tax=Rhizophora mucronata TaxID=61149 RepID=A0A2P2NC07_RHIMU
MMWGLFLFQPFFSFFNLYCDGIIILL